MKQEINIPRSALVVLIGPSGSGKSTFAKKHFLGAQIISSDNCRAIVSDDENNQKASKDAFDLLHYTAAIRLKNGLLTVIDATNTQAESRTKLINRAREYHCLPVAIVLDVPEKLCIKRNEERSDRNFGSHVIRRQKSQLRRSVRNLKKEGFRNITVLKSEEEVNSIANINLEKLYNDKQEITGPFDIIGDVHGCLTELIELLIKLGYTIEKVQFDMENYGYQVTCNHDRKVVFLGDLVDRGPDSPGVLKLVMHMVKNGLAYCVPGNHDVKLQKFLAGKNVQLKHGLQETVDQLSDESDDFKAVVKEFIYSLVSHLVFDEGKLVVTHAGLKEEMQGRASGAVRAFCLYGETSGEIDEFGLPVRHDWAAGYRGEAKVVYGHTPVPEAEWLNNTIDIDTGCVFGGKLTALKYPELELISVVAKEQYCIPAKPLVEEKPTDLNHQQSEDDLLDIADLTGKKTIHTGLRNLVTIKEENGINALETLTRFSVNPKWLIYLPPTMSPAETSALADYLEHPTEALAYYSKRGINNVICEEKHMGSRVVVVICKDQQTVINRFGITDGSIGICYTRTGRNFFKDKDLEVSFLTRVRDGLSKSGFWEKFDTDWVCLDAELLPWSAKAQMLLKNQYAAVGASGSHAIKSVLSYLSDTESRSLNGITQLKDDFAKREVSLLKYIKAYQQYCWPVSSLDDYRLAPFHILATEGKVHIDKKHQWHMDHIAQFCQVDPKFLKATICKAVDLSDQQATDELILWWEKLTQNGGEGMVVKPADFVARSEKGLIQPAIKCRGREYLRIIYGPEYANQVNLATLKSRNVGRKRSLALREFALGIEGLERFVTGQPLRKVHECAFGVLALESEPVDPRL